MILVTAVIITIIRLLLLPNIGIYRNEIEAWVSGYMNLPVEFHFIDSTWHSWIPRLTLADITIWNKAGTQAITHFDRATIQIAFIDTLIERQFIPKSLLVSGLELSIIHHENGSISVRDTNSVRDTKLETNKNKETGQNKLVRWVFKQKKIEIQNAEIELVDIKNREEPILFTDVTFKLRNEVNRFQVDGSTTISNENESKINFAFDAFGDLLTLNWSGKLYVSAKNISPDNWYKKHRPLNFDTAGGLADLEVRSSWQQSKLSDLEGKLQYKNFTALIESKSIQVHNLVCNFLGERDNNDGWQIQVALDNFQTENGAWPTTELSITAQPTGDNTYQYTTHYEYLKIGELAPLLITSAFLSNKAKQFLNELSIEGELRNGKLVYDPSKEAVEQVSYETEFAHLTTSFGKDLPSFSNLSGRIAGTKTEGTVSLQSSNSTLSIFTEDKTRIELSRLTGEILWIKNDSAWALNTKRLEIENTNLSAIIKGGVSKNESQNSPFVDLIMRLDQSKLELIPNYLHGPQLVGLKNWMKKALLAGTVKSASALFRGQLQDFPFDNNNGCFEIVVDIEGATVDYSTRWPPVDKLSGEIIFNERQMTANINSGMIFNTEITHANVTMPDILAKRKRLEIDGHINGVVKDLTLFIEQSPLWNFNIMEASAALQAGNFDLNLKLDILDGKKGKKPDIDVDSQINFANVMVESSGISLTDLEGNFNFTSESGSTDDMAGEFYLRQSWSTEEARGRYFSRPITLSMQYLKSDGENQHPASIVLSGSGDNQFIIDHIVQYIPYAANFQDELKSRISGEAKWQVKLSYRQNEQSGQITKLFEVTLDFNGLALDFPAPFRKAVDEISLIELTTETSLSGNQTVAINYNSDLFVKLVLDKTAKEKLQLVRISAGKKLAAPDSKHNFFIGGSLDYLSINEWNEIIKLISDKRKSSHHLLNDLEIDLQLSELNLFNHISTNVKVLAQKDENGWLINLNGEEIKGDIILPKEMNRDSQIVVQLEKLHLNKRAKQPSASEVNPTNMPALLVNVDDFSYYNSALGQFQLQTLSKNNKMSIDYFKFNKPALSIEGQGNWIVSKTGHSSNSKIKLNAGNMDTILGTFNYNLTSIKGGPVNMQIDVNWPGSPMEFNLRDLNGKIDIQISNGQLLGIKPSAGRLFGLLSVYALPRRLFLDFSDLFNKGLTFDSIRGNFTIDGGNAYTSNLHMKAPSANIVISGRTGLADHDWDQIAVVTPQISGILPIAGGVTFGLVGISIGTAIYLASKMFKPISHDNGNYNNDILSRQYTITGSWENPVVKRIKSREYGNKRGR